MIAGALDARCSPRCSASPWPVIAFAGAAAVTIVFLHRANISPARAPARSRARRCRGLSLERGHRQAPAVEPVPVVLGDLAAARPDDGAARSSGCDLRTPSRRSNETSGRTAESAYRDPVERVVVVVQHDRRARAVPIPVPVPAVDALLRPASCRQPLAKLRAAGVTLAPVELAAQLADGAVALGDDVVSVDRLQVDLTRPEEVSRAQARGTPASVSRSATRTESSTNRGWRWACSTTKSSSGRFSSS